MSGTPAPTRGRDDRSWAPGLVLVAIGLALLAVQLLDVGEEIIPAIVGAAFLVAYALTRRYGFLVPAGILLGAGVGIAVGTRYDAEDWLIPLAVGLGFLSIYVIDRAVTGDDERWWPLIPGGISALAGIGLAARGIAALEPILRWWPAALIALGAWLLLRRR